MPSIITATDFSEVSLNAAHYACGIASAQNAEVVVLHSFVIPVMFSDIPMPTSLINDTQDDAELQMKKLVADLTTSYPDVTITGKVFYGDTVDIINEYTSENNTPWLVVIGNNNDGEHGTWPDSTLSDALKKLKYPVLAIPSGMAYRNPSNICFAFDNIPEKNDTALGQLMNITLQLKAQLHVVNIKVTIGADTEEDIDGQAKNMLAAVSPIYHFISVVTDIDGAISTFVSGNNIDWLVMIPRKHSFFEGLFHKSHTTSIAHHAKIPILALHEFNG